MMTEEDYNKIVLEYSSKYSIDFNILLDNIKESQYYSHSNELIEDIVKATNELKTSCNIKDKL